MPWKCLRNRIPPKAGFVFSSSPSSPKYPASPAPSQLPLLPLVWLRCFFSSGSRKRNKKPENKAALQPLFLWFDFLFSDASYRTPTLVLSTRYEAFYELFQIYGLLHQHTFQQILQKFFIYLGWLRHRFLCRSTILLFF